MRRFFFGLVYVQAHMFWYLWHILLFQKFSREFNFRETSHMGSFMKIIPLRIGDITLLFTDIGKSCPVRDFLRRKCVF